MDNPNHDLEITPIPLAFSIQDGNNPRKIIPRLTFLPPRGRSNTAVCCHRFRPKISYGYPVLQTLYFFSLVSELVLSERSMPVYAFPVFSLCLFLRIRLLKRKIPLWATCTTTIEHSEETSRHGAIFYLEIPSVIILGASRARGEE
ncbi:hypothetical protein ACQKWADRAFT_301764 [Trichoderma austrokoningii]